MRVRVFALVKKAGELAGKQGVRILNRAGLAQVDCELSTFKAEGGRTLYNVKPKADLPDRPTYYELQIIEWGEKNIGAVVTNRAGRKLIPRWRAEHTVGFRTSKGKLIQVVAYGIREMGEFLEYSLQMEGKTPFLTEERTGMFVLKGDKLQLDKEETTPLADAAIAALERARCFCFKKGCRYHFALSEHEAKELIAVRELEKAIKEGTEEGLKAAHQLEELPEPTPEEAEIPETAPAPKAAALVTEAPAPEMPAAKEPTTKKGGRKASKK